MKATTISKLKEGQYFTFKRYEYYKFVDIGSYNFAKRDLIVYVDFIF